jgi:hypothetical protein
MPTWTTLDEKAAAVAAQTRREGSVTAWLVKAANDLTAALARLADNGPGKKEEAKEKAKAAGTGRFATPEAPKPARRRIDADLVDGGTGLARRIIKAIR